jgi:ankyrin repeat protein
VDNIYEFCGGKTALHWATIRGYVEVVKLLLEHHANPRHRDHHHNTVLHHAALSTKGRQLIPLFLERKINIHARDQDGDTALHLATIFGDFDCIRMLLMAGASYSIKNKEGCYPRQMEGAIGKTRLYLFHCEMKQTYVETFHVYGMLPVDLVRMLCRYLI